MGHANLEFDLPLDGEWFADGPAAALFDAEFFPAAPVSRIRVSWTRISPAAPAGAPGIFLSAGAWGYKSLLLAGDVKVRLQAGALIASTSTAAGTQLSLSGGTFVA